MKKMKSALLGLALLCLFGTAQAQKKYAVLITGDNASWENGLNSVNYGAMEFWNDTWLTYKMLLDADFEPQNIIVLFGDGRDATEYLNNPILHTDYRPAEWEAPMTDYAATLTNVTNVLNGLRYGTNNMPHCTENDFLYIYTFGRGATTPTFFKQGIKLQGQTMWARDFAELVNPIAANKKVFMMAQAFCGGFRRFLSAPNTLFMASTPDTTDFYSLADNEAKYIIPEGYEFAGAEATVTVVENEVLNGKTYWHSEWNFHMFHAFYQQRLDLSYTYYVNGHTGQHKLFSEADINEDGYTTFMEAHAWTEENKTYEDFRPVVNILDDPSNIAATTSLKYPTILADDLTSDMVVSGLIGVTKDVHVTSGQRLTLSSKCKLEVDEMATLYVDEGATLVIEDGAEVLLGGTSKIVVNGNIVIGSDVILDVDVNDETPNFSSFTINNAIMVLDLNSVEINKLATKFVINNLSVNNCSFNQEANLSIDAPNAQIVNSQFDQSKLNLTVLRGVSGVYTTAIVDGNTFTGPVSTAVEINGYENFNVSRNTFSRAATAISVYHAGNGAPSSQNITNNHISNCTQSGITVYNSNVVLGMNTVVNNYVGIKLLNGSNVSLEGDVNAADIFSTQLIWENTSHQIFVSQNSFPWYMKFNAIIDDYNTVPLVKYERPGQPYIKVDVADNFWGVDFSATTDLYIDNGKYGYLPMWQPLNPYYPTELELQYKAANDAFAAGNFAEAKAQYMDIIADNPESVYAEASMKELIRVEPSAKGNLSELKAYYQTNTVIAANENLSVLGEFLANLCDVHMENWADAIAWYEAKIMNPANEQERIFAEIDLGYTYFLMENSANKAAAAVTGMLRQHKYETVKAYNTNRDYLLSLLPGEAASENVKQELRTMETGALLQNYPNPFSQSTTIWYKTDRDAAVQLVVYEMTGKEVARMNEGRQTKGTHSVEFTNSNLSEGIYFYTLTLDGQRTDSKKMNVVR